MKIEMTEEEEKEMLAAGHRFIEDEQRRYEEWLELPTPFSIKVHNWLCHIEYKIKSFIDSCRPRRLIANYRWRHGGRENFNKYMKSVHECYERARNKKAEEKKPEIIRLKSQGKNIKLI